MTTDANALSLHLRVGEVVEVRTEEEILATLDAKGCLDGLPFMPEMFKYCGSRQRVVKRAHKTCDSIHYTGSRRMVDAVHLADIRCDGHAHGGCQAECLIFWKEAWLTRAPEGIPRRDSSQAPEVPVLRNETSCTELMVRQSCTRTIDGEQLRYVCQATQLRAATSPLAWWNLRQYWEDYTSGNVDLRTILIGFCHSLLTVMRKVPWLGVWIKRLYNGLQRLRGKPRHPRTWGRIAPGKPTPSCELNLQPGELARVKSFDAILDTITQDYYNRGMKWDAEMVPYCGGTYRVRCRVKQIINESTGAMIQLKSPCVILDGVVCQARYSDCRLFCPRSTFAYWREVWLERVSAVSGTAERTGNEAHT